MPRHGVFAAISVLREFSTEMTVAVPVQFHLVPPPRIPGAVAIVLHGYGSNKERMLGLAREFVPETYGILSLQGMHQNTQISRRTGTIYAGYGWGTADNLEDAIALHHSALRKVIHSLLRRGIASRESIVLAGFSEPVLLNYSYAEDWGSSLAGVVGICGDIPIMKGSRRYPPMFHLAGASDPFASLPTLASRVQAIQSVGIQLRFSIYEAGHEITAEMKRDVRGWLRRLQP